MSHERPPDAVAGFFSLIYDRDVTKGAIALWELEDILPAPDGAER